MSKVFTWVNCPKAVRALALPFAAASSIGVFVSLRPVAITLILHQNENFDKMKRVILPLVQQDLDMVLPVVRNSMLQQRLPSHVCL